MSEKIERPAEQEVKKFRGTGIIYLPQNAFEFVPQKEGKPQQTDVKRYGTAKAYTTVGKDPKRVITLQCRADTTDPRAELFSQFTNVMKSEYNAEIPKGIKPKGKILANTDSLKMTLNKQESRIEVSFFVPTTPEGKKSVKDMFYDKIIELSKCFATNESTIQKSK